MHDLASNLAANVRRLREEHGLSQQQAARQSGMPRATWTSLESGRANPTLAVLSRAAATLQVSIEELIGAPRAAVQLCRSEEIRRRKRQGAVLRPLVAEAIPGLEMTRMELEPAGRMTGVPHTPGTREYLACERGCIELSAAGECWRLQAGDVVVFRGDQRHAYTNPDRQRTCLAISVVCFSMR